MTGRLPLDTRGMKLSRMESRVVALIAEAYTDKEIATALDIGVGTVRNYAFNARAKLGFPPSGNHRVRLARWHWDNERREPPA